MNSQRFNQDLGERYRTDARSQGSARKTEVLIIGSGLAGLLTAILLFDAGARVTIASKSKFVDSNTSLAQGGLAAILKDSAGDSFQSHLADTIKSGAGLTVPQAAREIITAAPDLVRTLARLGIAFDSTANGEYQLAREGGHSYGRILHAKDTTGRTISGALLEQLQIRANKSPHRLILLENCFAESLVTKNGCLTGAVLREVDGSRSRCISAEHVVLATGGAGQIYARTTNPAIATADGVALAYRAGAVLADLEFMQFHPTALSLSGAPAFLISEAVRGEGALLIDGNGRRFAGKYHPDAELATRDVVARAIHATMLEQELESVGLDLRPIGKQELLQKFPNIINNCRQFGIDPLTMPVPVAPAAHYFMGGVMTDTSGRTSVPGLYCIGEVAATGLHGANRLASNSLLEAGVMAMKLTDFLTHKSRTSRTTSLLSMSPFKKLPDLVVPDLAVPALQVVPQSLSEFRQSMFKHAGLTRTETGLSALIQSFAGNAVVPSTPDSHAQANMLLVAELIARAAWLRRESRGAHFRQEFPQSDDHQYLRRLTVCSDDWLWTDLVPDHLAREKQALSA